jgi:hypothetical protein
MAFKPQYQIVVDYWRTYPAQIPPQAAPTGQTHIQLLKPKIAFSPEQMQYFGAMFVNLICSVEIFPLDDFQDAQQGPTLFRINSSQPIYLRVYSRMPICADETVIAWNCLCVNAEYPLTRP